MPEPPDLDARVSALEVRIEEVAAEARTARHLAAAGDRDLADLGVKVDANRKAINALGVQTAARFDRLEGRVDRLETRVDAGFAAMDLGFAEVRGRLDQTAAGLAHIGDLLTTLIERDRR
jgi:hypothetical protein